MSAATLPGREHDQEQKEITPKGGTTETFVRTSSPARAY